jgi:hypothetical protein
VSCGDSFFSDRVAAEELPDAPSIEEQEAQLEEEAQRRAQRRRFDEGFAEYEHRRRDEEIDRIEDPSKPTDPFMVSGEAIVCKVCGRNVLTVLGWKALPKSAQRFMQRHAKECIDGGRSG